MLKSSASEPFLPSHRLTFVWGRPANAPAPWRAGLFCSFRLGKSLLTGKPFLPAMAAGLYPRAMIVSIRGLLCWGALFAVLVYFGGAAMLHTRLAAAPCNQIRYSDLVSPWRWSEIPDLRARATLEHARASHKNGRFTEAFHLLRAGLARRPADADARMLLARMYVVLLRRDQAEALIFEGLEHGEVDPPRLQEALALLGESDRPSRVVDFCRGARSAGRAGQGARVLLAACEAEALLEAADPRAAAELIDDPTLPPDVPIRRARVKTALALGNREDAIAFARDWTRDRPRDGEALATLVGVYREAGRFADMEESLAALRRLNPANPDFVSMGVLQNLLAGRRAEARAAFDELIFRFGADRSLLSTLADGLGGLGDLEMLDLLEDVYRERGFDPQGLWMNRVVVLIGRGDWAAAREAQGALAARKETLTDAIRVFTETSGALIDYCIDGTPVAKSEVLEMLVRHRGRLKLYLHIADAMLAARRWEGARDVLLLAEGSFPQSRRLAVRRERLAPELAALAGAETRRAEDERRASEGAGAPASAAAFLAAVESDLRAGNAGFALRRIGTIRREAPSWLPDVRDKIDGLELDTVLSMDDLPRLKQAARDHLREGRAGRVERIVEAARVAGADGRTAVARILLGEVLRMDPRNAAALAVLGDHARDGAQE